MSDSLLQPSTHSAMPDKSTDLKSRVVAGGLLIVFLVEWVDFVVTRVWTVVGPPILTVFEFVSR
jgi:hypothetical protein